MRTVTFKSVLAGVLRREGGGNLLTSAATAAEIAKFCDYIADRLRTAWEYYIWPECYVTELRRFRAEYSAASTYATGAEVWFVDSADIGGYYTALEAIALTESPEAAPTKWEALTTLRRFVAFDQPGKTEFEACVGAWTADPESVKSAMRMQHLITTDGVLLPPTCPIDGAWLKVRRKCPDFAAEQYDAAVAYAVGARVYFDDLMEVYKCVTATTAGQTPATHASKWELVEFPMILARAVKAGALADWQRSDGEGSAKKTADSEANFTALLDEQVFQLTKLQGQTGRPDVVPAP